MDEKLKWLETRINSSLRPRNEDVKNMFFSDENRLAFHEFLNNEDVRRLFVFIRPPRQIIASLQPPNELNSKSIFFLKNNAGVKLSKDNLDEEVMFLDCSDNALQQLDLLAREVYLPLLCTDSMHASEYGISADKMMDVLHRLMAVVETTEGHIEGEITLPLPSIEVLADAASNNNRRSAVMHVMETTVIGWMKQIRGVLKHDPISDLERQSGDFPGPLDEIQLWETRLEKLHSINSQLDSPVALDILRNLEESNSSYASSFHTVRKDIQKAMLDTENNLCMLSTMAPLLQQLHICLDPVSMLRLFPPLIHTLMLVWGHSNYYHQAEKFQNLLRLISNEVVHRAEAMVGEDVLHEPLESYSKLKEALRVCAAFRGTYLDYREKAEDMNERNKQDHAEKMVHHPYGSSLFSTKMYGSGAYTPRYGLASAGGGDELALRGDELSKDSPWPPRNAPAFDLLNAFMERCNDVLELVQTTRHFRLLADAAEIGGAGTASLDALVREIHNKYSQAMEAFFSLVTNVLDVDGTQTFEKAFFVFRTVVKDLERRLSEVLRQGFHQCPTIGAQLRLLDVFEGISSRELVQSHLKDKDRVLVESFTAELIQVRGMFHNQQKNPPQHKNMPAVVSKLLWINALKQRVQLPMQKMKKVSPQSLEGDLGWHLRDAFAEAMADFEKYETRIVAEWQKNITAELTDRLKQPLLVAEEYDEDMEVRPQVVHVNLDPNLLLLLREIHYLSQDPFNLHLPGTARQLLRNTNSRELNVTATRLDTIVAKYNTVMKTISQYELPLFERSLAKIDLLFEQGLHEYTWRTEESADFIETATALVCVDLHRNLDVVQTNCAEILQLTLDWSRGVLDVFSARDPNKTYDVEDLKEAQLRLSEEFENAVVPAGNRIHTLLQSSFEAVNMSEASPAWQNYVDYIDAIVLDGLKQACLTSLKSMLNEIIHCNMAEEEELVPILVIRQELIENEVAFRPPLDQSTSYTSVQETIRQWLDGFLARGRLVSMLSGKGCYADYISVDEEVQQLMESIDNLVRENAGECRDLFQIFKDFSFLWHLDVNQTFEEFLRGKMSPNVIRSPSKHMTPGPSHMRAVASARSSSRASSAKSSIESAGLVGTAERTFLTPKEAGDKETSIPSLDEFDTEIDIYRTARDEALALQDFKDVGWLRVDLRPIKQMLVTYACKWMWTFTKYLSDQVTSMLENLDAFLKRTEPEIESITGEERDTASFMRMMRLFNEVSAQQQEMDAKFAAMHRTVLLVKKYGQTLPDSTQQLFDAAPGRWNNLKTKVSLAKQRLGPRIQEESERISRDLATFGQRVNALHEDLDRSDVYNREFSLSNAWTAIESFMKRLAVLENEAQDLIELQELLEANVVNFNLLPECRQELSCLKQVWETCRVIDEQQSEWKRHRWQKMNTEFLRDETAKQLEIVGALPEEVFTWDVYMGLHESITTIQACLPLIDDLSNPAMRTRHWKQLVRVTGGAVQADNDTLKRMTLGELLSLGLQKHVDDVRAIVQRAVKDLGIEQSLKTYEEVWLGKIFELREHVRNRAIENSEKIPGPVVGDSHGDTQSEASHTESVSQAPGATGATASRSQGRTMSRVSNQSSATRGRHASASSLPQSLLYVGENSGGILLLNNTEPVFEELESHQVALQTMQGSSAAGSFLDEVLKWQKRLQTIEAVLTIWLQTQELWTLLEDVYNTQEVKTALSADANLFALANREFRLLMKATEKNPNVLQCCQRKNILPILEKLHRQFERCRRSLLNHLEKRRHKYPRFYFLSIQDVLQIVCNGYDLGQVSLYISKVFENMGNLLYEPVDDNDRCIYQVVGVESALGEKLFFLEPVMCEGPIDSWLGNYTGSVKSALQDQLVSALKKESLQKRPLREIHSAGARRVTIEKKTSVNKHPGKEKGGSRTASRTSVAPGTPTPALDSIPRNAARKDGANSWLLDHVSEVVYLSTQIELCTQMAEAVAAAETGNKDAIQAAVSKLNDTLANTVVMLKGVEDKEEVIAQRQKSKTESEGHSLREHEKRSETMSEVASQGGTQRSHPAVPSHRGSVMEVNQDPPPTIPEEDSQRPEDSPSLLEPQTSEPMDTMNLSAMPVIKKTEESELDLAEQQLDSPELKNILYPSQIQKISSLIALMAHQRDVLEELGREAGEGGDGVTDSLRWKIQLVYNYDEESKIVSVNALDTKFDYGFEYLGSAAREVITPQTERVFLGLCQAIQSHASGLCMGQAGVGSLSTLHEFSRALGRPFYNFNCTGDMDHLMLTDIFKGLAMTGSWVCFNHINQLSATVLSILSQHLATVLTGLKASKSSIQIHSQDIHLAAEAACFAVVDSAVKITTHSPEHLLMFPSVISQLPSNLLSQFRCVSIVKPDSLPLMEVLLLSQGYMNARDLAKKTVTLFSMCRDLIGTNANIDDDTSQLTFHSHDSSFGWSQQTLKYIAIEAGTILDNIISRKLALRVEQQKTVEDEFFEDEEEEELSTREPAAPTPAPTEMTKEDALVDESEALVMALRNNLMPRLQDRDASIFSTLLGDLWPQVIIPMAFGGKATPESAKSGDGSHKENRRVSKEKTQVSKSFRSSIQLNTPVVPMSSTLGDNFVPEESTVHTERQSIDNIDDAIAIATSNLGLMPGTAFQARVSQLAMLNLAHRTIIVAGPAGCGKSEIIKTFALAERERGKTIDVQSVFTKAYESEGLLGYWHPETREWKEGLVPELLGKFCTQNGARNKSSKHVLPLLQLDGQLDATQFELMESILHNEGSVVLGNSERLVIPEALRFIWETDSLASVSPSLLASVGVLCVSADDVGWALPLASWIEQRPEMQRDIVRELCDIYIESVVQYLQGLTKPPIQALPNDTGPFYSRVMPGQTVGNMVNTFTSLFETLIPQNIELSDTELERCFNYACIWGFAGTLDEAAREPFSQWWKQTFEQHIDFPNEGLVFDYMVETENFTFVRWSEITPSYSGTPHDGIPSDAFVHTVNTQQMLHMLGLLSDAGRPVMLIGENGCGKSSVVNERIRTVCSGEVAEVLALTIQSNRFTNARLVYQRLDERLEWKHGKTHVPKGNKRLMCFIDDLNLSQVDKHFNQSAVELVRQHIDDGGFYNQDNHQWRYVKAVTYVTTVNPNTSATVPPLNPRLLRHFAMFNCPYPKMQQLDSIFSTLLQTHLLIPEMSGPGSGHHLSGQDEKGQAALKVSEASLRSLIGLVVRVNLELQTKLRSMFLPTAQRCHYLFTLKDLATIFRNMCLSLQPGCSHGRLLLLWEHECDFVYGRRMINEVDYDRFRQAFVRAIRKDFSDEEHIQLLTEQKKPIFSNLVEQDSGLVTAGNIFGNMSSGGNLTDSDLKTDLFGAAPSVEHLKELMEHGVEEYNKSHPRIKLPLYRTVVEQVCRLARVIASPHEVAHSVLVAEGCTARCAVIAQLAAHLCGYTVFKINPSPISSPVDYKMDTFKADLVAAYTRAGVKGEKILFLLEEEEMQEEDYLVLLAEFVMLGSISHLFSIEESTTIINSIRTEVTQAGLAYTRDVAWQFFLRQVKKNFRICFIALSGGHAFQRRCREYPTFTKSVNFLWFPHWSKKLLIEHALFHLKEVSWLERIQQENLAHMLATMHIVIRQQDGQEQGPGQYQHLTNFTYEKFVEKFISLMEAKHTEINSVHDNSMEVMKQIQHENRLAAKLKKDLEHEKIVLEERKMGTVRILSQIGQDRAITEQQIKIVKAQMDKIHTLKKLLPEYQVAHERAVYKTVAIVADTKKIVQNIKMDSLSELRGMQKPIIEMEDLMAAIIMILKNPQADLTWQKGAKRQMANLERFIEELLMFDENVLPESTLVLVEPYLRKPSFDHEVLEKKTSNSACASLCRWVKGVCRYHRMMISKVKPLHAKVEHTTQAIDSAEHKMSLLENKRQALEVRLADLAKGFEEATIDKNDQDEKTIRMDKMLETAARFRKVLRHEQYKHMQIVQSKHLRESDLPGPVAMAAAFATYLGPYHYNFRRLMLTAHWPSCLQERGVSLIIDSIHAVKGRVIDFAIGGVKTPPDAQFDFSDLDMDNDGEEEEEEEGESEAELEDLPEEKELDGEDDEAEEKGDEDKDAPEDDEEEEKAQRETMEKDEPKGEEEKKSELLQNIPEEEERLASGGGRSQPGSDSVVGPPPMLTSQEYNQYTRALTKLLVGDDTFLTWTKKDFGPRQMENAAIVKASWQRPPMLLDPYGDGTSFLNWYSADNYGKHPVPLNMDTRWTDAHVIMTLEKCIMRGRPVLLENCDSTIDSLIHPVIQHINTANEHDHPEESRMIKYCGRRILCHPNFRLFLVSPKPKPAFTSHVASVTNVVNFGSSNESIVDDLLTRAFASLRQDLYKERRLVQEGVHTHVTSLVEVMRVAREQMRTGGKSMILQEKNVDHMSALLQQTSQIAMKVKDLQTLLSELENLKEELFPLARRGTMLLAVLRSLAALQPSYNFPLPYFLRLFDEALGGEFPEEYLQQTDPGQVDDEDVSVSSDADHVRKRRASSTGSQAGADTAAAAGKPEAGEEADDTETGEKNLEEEGEHGGEDKDTSEEDADEELPLPDLPDCPQLPSDGVDYASLPDDALKQTIDKLTALVFQTVQQSLYEEDRLLFATLVCLNIQEEAQLFSEEEMSLLLQGNPGLGMQLSLVDFDCDADPPSWLPTDKWEDILAVSVLPGPLDSLCVAIAQNPEEWRDWYKDPNPELLPLPQAGAKKHDQEEKERDEEEEESGTGGVSDFHKLLLMRLLRADRFHSAMANYVNENFSILLELSPPPDMNQLMERVQSGHTGVLVLLPQSVAPNSLPSLSSLKMTQRPVDIIRSLAQRRGVGMEVVQVGEGNEMAINDALDAAERENTWLLIEHLHLASPKYLRHLRHNLTRMAKHAAGQEKSSQGGPCVWITMEPSASVPQELLQPLYKLAWDSLQHLFSSGDEAGGEMANTEALFTADGLHDVLVTAITSTFKSVPDDVWQKVQELPAIYKLVVFSLGVVTGMLDTRQLLGTRGMTQFYPFGVPVYTQALDTLCSMVNNSESEPQLQLVVDILAQNIYGNQVCSALDHDYVTYLASSVMKMAAEATEDVMQVGAAQIPIPPATLGCGDFGTWFEENASGQVNSLEALSLFGCVDRETNEASSTKFMGHLEKLYECQNMDIGDIGSQSASSTGPGQINMLRLRAILDDLVEQLPPLLELGQVPAAMTTEYDFPYHRPSIVSVATAASALMPESIGFVLLQECLWFNSLLCHIRQNIHTIHECLLGGEESIPRELQRTVNSLVDELVPTAWLHPNCQPSTHTLASWQQDFKQRYQQMQGWVRHQMVPIYKSTSDNTTVPVSHGRLRRVWLGGLVNPSALFTALRQEKAVISNLLMDEVSLRCEAVGQLSADEMDDDAGVILTQLHLQGASWDHEKNMLVQATSDISALPDMYVHPVLTSATQPQEEATKFPCPVYMNKSRQVSSVQLALSSTDPAHLWLSSGTVILLDPGVPEDASKKSRQFAPVRLNVTDTDQTSARTSQPSGSGGRGGDEVEVEDELLPMVATGRAITTDRSEPSTHSQLSYKPMTPLGDPLPPTLQMTRERPMAPEARTREQEAVAKSESPLPSPRSPATDGKNSPTVSQKSSVKNGSVKAPSPLALKSGGERYSSSDSVAKKGGKSPSSRHSSRESLGKKSVRSSDERYASKESVGKRSTQSSRQSHHSSSNSLTAKSDRSRKSSGAEKPTVQSTAQLERSQDRPTSSVESQSADEASNASALSQRDRQSATGASESSGNQSARSDRGKGTPQGSRRSSKAGSTRSNRSSQASPRNQRDSPRSETDADTPRKGQPDL